jgi:hypothetical protein
VAQAVDVDAVPLDMASAGGDAQDGAFLRAAHHHAHHDLVALAEDVVDGGVRVGERGDDAGEQPGDVSTTRDRAHRAAEPLHVRSEEVLAAGCSPDGSAPALAGATMPVKLMSANDSTFRRM